MKKARLLRWIGLTGSGLVLIVLLAFTWAWSKIENSLPLLEGELAVASLTDLTTVTRDAQGVVTVSANHQLDSLRGLGFAHGQDRFFQMDLLRRRAAGELSGLFGAAAVPTDKASIVHRFRLQAQAVLSRESASRLEQIEAYVTGVNAGLDSLPAKPWEYQLTRTEPDPWLAEDCVLVIYAMALDLANSTGSYEKTLTTLRDTLGTVAVDFFNPLIGPDDSALDGSTAPLRAPPSAQILDLRRTPPPLVDETLAALPERTPVGSNAFLVPGDRTSTGAGLLAGDPHLALRLPNVWYRARLEWPDAKGEKRQVTGATIPGIPGIIIGSNGHIAWSFTNASVDIGDLIALDLNPVAPEYLYLYGKESREFETHTDIITVKGNDPVEVKSTWTEYGPVVGRDSRDKTLVFHWTFHDPTTINFDIMDLNHATDVETAISIAHRTGMPNQNMLVVDRKGTGAWTLTGQIPRRFGYDGRFPVSWTYGDRGWNGFLSPDERPVIRAAPGQPLWSGNQRQIGGDALTRSGDSGYDSAERATQIERDLQALPPSVTAPDLQAIHLDHRAQWSTRWRELLLATLDQSPPSSDHATYRQIVADWDGQAEAKSVGYRLMRTWHSQLASATLHPIFKKCREKDPQFGYRQLRYESALWALHRDEPIHLLSLDYPNWHSLRLAAVDKAIAVLNESGTPFSEATWGEANRLAMRHPFSNVLPEFLTSWLNLPPLPQSGDSRMPRVARPEHGASLRMVISPGHEENGIYHQPGGQSGNPLSLFYRAGHEDWVRGNPSPFLPGETVHTLTLTPHPPSGP